MCVALKKFTWEYFYINFIFFNAFSPIFFYIHDVQERIWNSLSASESVMTSQVSLLSAWPCHLWWQVHDIESCMSQRNPCCFFAHYTFFFLLWVEGGKESSNCAGSVCKQSVCKLSHISHLQEWFNFLNYSMRRNFSFFFFLLELWNSWMHKKMNIPYHLFKVLFSVCVCAKDINIEPRCV